MQHKNIIIICGPLCSGKSTFAKTLVNHRHIEIGDFVRRATAHCERMHLPGLDFIINSALTHEIALEGDLVITGIRQKSIYDHVIEVCRSFKLTHETLWLDVPKAVLFKRFIDRNDIKDHTTSFEKALDKDNELGLRELKDYLLTQTTTKVIKNYDTDSVQKIENRKDPTVDNRSSL